MNLEFKVRSSLYTTFLLFDWFLAAASAEITVNIEPNCHILDLCWADRRTGISFLSSFYFILLRFFSLFRSSFNFLIHRWPREFFTSFANVGMYTSKNFSANDQLLHLTFAVFCFGFSSRLASSRSVCFLLLFWTLLCALVLGRRQWIRFVLPCAKRSHQWVTTWTTQFYCPLRAFL